MIILTLAISATFFEVSISAIILGVWSLLGAVGLYKNNHFLLKILFHDFDLTYHEKTLQKRPIQVAIALAIAVVCFLLPLFYT
jgi:hypothetical protein